MATTTQTQTKANEILDCGLTPVLLGWVGDALKRPILPNWPNAEYTADEVAGWPADNNIGIRCGLTLLGLWLYVFDFDHDAARIFPAWFAAAKKLLPHVQWVIVKTSKGYHVYLFTDAPQNHNKVAMKPVQGDNGRSNFLTLIEIIGEGRQVVSAGSKHPAGGQYELIAGGLANIPTVGSAEYKLLFDLAESYDLRPKKKAIRQSQQRRSGVASTGDLAGVNNCLDYARGHIAGEVRQENDGQFRVMGNGGLLITADGRAWYCMAEQTGGGLVRLIKWHRNISIREAVALLRSEPSMVSDYAHKKLSTGGDLVRSAFGGDPVMVAPSPDYFDSRYPHEWVGGGHTCNNYLDGYSDEGGQTILRRHTSKLWRARGVGDLLICACPGCQHDYGMRACWQLEVEAGAYDHERMPFRYQILKIHQAKKLISTGRNLEGHTFRYWRRPLMGGRVAIIHNVNDFGESVPWATERQLKQFNSKAHDIPRDRTKLYDLVMGWIKDVNSDRTSHSKGWGGDFKGVKGDGRSDAQKKDKPVIHFITEWKAAHDAIADYLNVVHVPKQTGLHIVDFLDILDLAGVKYGIQRGQDELKAMRKSYKVHSGNKNKSRTMYLPDINVEIEPISPHKDAPDLLKTAVFIPDTPRQGAQYAA